MSYPETPPLIGDIWIWQSQDAKYSKGPYLVLFDVVEDREYWNVQVFNLTATQKEVVFFYRGQPTYNDWLWKKL